MIHITSGPNAFVLVHIAYGTFFFCRIGLSVPLAYHYMTLLRVLWESKPYPNTPYYLANKSSFFRSSTHSNRKKVIPQHPSRLLWVGGDRMCSYSLSISHRLNTLQSLAY